MCLAVVGEPMPESKRDPEPSPEPKQTAISKPTPPEPKHTATAKPSPPEPASSTEPAIVDKPPTVQKKSARATSEPPPET